MHDAGWELERWPRVVFDGDVLCPRRYRHVTSWLTDGSVADSVARGRTVWGSIDSPFVVIAWDWAGVAPGVLSLADPMSIASNLRLRRRGMRASANALLLPLNALVHQLSWQTAVRRALSARQPPRGPGERHDPRGRCSGLSRALVAT